MQSAIWTQQRRSCGTALPKAKLAYLGIRGKYIHGWLFARYAATCSRNFYTAMIPDLSPPPDPSFACHTTFMAAWCNKIRLRSCLEEPEHANFSLIFPVIPCNRITFQLPLSRSIFLPRGKRLANFVKYNTLSAPISHPIRYYWKYSNYCLIIVSLQLW